MAPLMTQALGLYPFPDGWWPPFGLFVVVAMMIFYALEDLSPWYILAFAAACALGSVYGFLQGPWPFGVFEAIWSVIAVRRRSATVGSRASPSLKRRTLPSTSGDETSPALVQLDFYTCGTLDKDAILKAITPWGVVKHAFLVLDREKDVVALEIA